MNQIKENHDFLLTFSDVVSVIKIHKTSIFAATITCALLFFFYGLTREVEYRVEATFKEKGKSQSGLQNSLSALLLNSEGQDSDAILMFRSRMLIEQLVKAHGLQATISKKNSNIPFLPLKRMRDNLLSEYANTSKPHFPVVASNDLPLIVQNVEYLKDVPLTLLVDISSENDYAIYREKGKLLGKGFFGKPFSEPDFTLTLVKASPLLPVQGQYQISLRPLGKTAEAIAQKFTIETDRLDSSLLKIAYLHPNQQQAVAHTTALMDLYKEHVHQEHQEACNLQIAYLQKKQAEMGKQLEELMKSHASHLASDLSHTGFADYTTAMNFLTSSQNNYSQRLQAIDLEMQWLKNTLDEGREGIDKLSSPQHPEIIHQLTKEIRQLKTEERSLELAIGKHSFQGSENRVRSLSNYFQGIDLYTAKELYLSYSKELNALDAKAAQLHYIIGKIHQPDFEISSLSSILTDPVSTEMLSKSSQLILALKDMDNRTPKEQERLTAALSLQKKFFITHVDQTAQLTQLQQQLTQENIEALQKIHLTLIREQISLLENQIRDYTVKRLASLDQEKHLYESYLAELRKEMSHLPQKWVKEQMIQQQMDINQNTIEQISKLVESKNLSSNLEKTQSRPIDRPLMPLHPRPPHLLLFTLLGAFTGAFLSTGWAIGKSIATGVAASADNLRLNGQCVCGRLSFASSSSETLKLLDTDLATLRSIISFMMSLPLNQNTLLLLCNQGPNYSMHLARLMHKMGLKTLLIDLCFDSASQPQNPVGLLHYLEGEVEKPTILHTDRYDHILSAGITRFSNELLASKKFEKLMADLQKDYDYVIAISRTPPLSAEAKTLLGQFPAAVITINQETLQDVRTHLLNGDTKVAFIFS